MPKRKSLTKMLATRESAGEYIGSWGPLPNPDRILSKLGKSQTTAYQDLLIDGHLTAVRESRAAAVKQLSWNIVRADASASTTKAIKKMFKTLDIDRFLDNILESNGYGMSPIEVKWELIDNKYWPTKLEGLPPKWFTFNAKNELRFLSQTSPYEGEEIPPYKILLARNNPTLLNPYGDALFSKSYWPITFKHIGMKFWARFVERFGFPWVWGKLPRGQTGEKEKDELLDMLTEAIQNAVIISPDDASIQIIEPTGKGTSAEIFKQYLYFMNSEISKIWLGETLTTEVQDKATQATATVQMAGPNASRKESDKLKACRIANELIKWIVELNFSGPSPEFVLVEKQSVNEDLARRDGILAEKLGFRPTKEYLSKNYGFEENEFEIAEVKPESAGLPPSENGGFSFKIANDKTALEKGIEKVTDPKLLQKQAEGILKPVISLIDDAQDYNEVLDKLLDTFPDMNTDEAEKWLRRAYFTSEALGRLST